MTSSNSPGDDAACLVIGGGIIGLSIAELLSTRGVPVRVIDHRPVAHAASWAAAGILPPPVTRALHDPMEQLRDLSHRRYQAWCERLQLQSDVEVPLDRCGGLHLARSVGERFSLLAAQEQWSVDDVRVERWSAKQLAAAEPQLGQLPDKAEIFFLPDEIQVRPPRMLKALTAILESRGVQVQHADTPITWQNVDDLTVCVDGETVQAKQICLAAGPWTERLLSSIGVRLPLEPRRGQIAAWQLPAPPLRRVVNEGPRYLVARNDGMLLAGSTVEDVGFDASETDAGLADVVNFARGLMPQLQHMNPTHTWAALRPMPIDGLPYLGAVPGRPKVFVATGHFRSGIHLAPATAELMCQLILGEPQSLDLDAFRLNR